MSIKREIGDRSDGSSSDSEDGYDNDDAITFDSMPNSKTIVYHVRGTYIKWRPWEAFRELVQNWRDAIIESNKLNPKDFRVKREAKGEAEGEATPPTGNTEIVYKAIRHDADNIEECLGFIRYKGRDGAGTIELSNLGATLHPEHLDFGGTSKEGRKDLAGAHGEGLKLAAMVLMHSRQNHHVMCHTGGCTLTFNFTDKARLVARLRRNKVQSKVRQPKNTAFPTPAVRANGDVQFVIGEGRQGRDQHGIAAKRRPVQQKDFKSWTKAALFLTKAEGEHDNIISTVHGDLLTSEDLRGTLYLKDLLLRESTTNQSASITGHRLGFGYNFALGYTNRERQSLADAREECASICRILSKALRAKPDLTAKVCDLLNSSDPRYAEAECDAKLWPRDIAVLFKQYLLAGVATGRWLYCGYEMKKNPRLGQIIEGMGREPFKLTDKLWNILVQYRLVRTAEEEGQQRYEDAQPLTVPKTIFAISVNRLLRACLRACSQTSTMKVEFVDAGQTHLDLYVSKTEPLVRIHERWLSEFSALSELGLALDTVDTEAAGYTAKRLFSDVLEHLPREAFLRLDNPRLPDSHMKRQTHRAEKRLAEYQRIELRISEKRHEGHNQLNVKWDVGARRTFDFPRIEVQLHQVSLCSHLRDNLLIAADAKPENMPCIPQEVGMKQQMQACEANVSSDKLTTSTCRVHRTDLRKGTHCERNLKEGEEYFFVLVTPEDPYSFVCVSNTKRVIARSPVSPILLTSEPPQLQSYNTISSSPFDDDNVDEGPNGASESDDSLYLSEPESSGADDSAAEVDNSPDVHNSSESEDEAPPPGRSLVAAERSDNVSRAPDRSAMNIAPGSFSLGPRLETLEILELALARDRWYRALNSDNVLAVIGIAKGEKVLAEESRKRRRID